MIYNDQLSGDVSLDIKAIGKEKGKRRFQGDRIFTVMSIKMLETFTLNTNDLQKIATEFPKTIEFFY